MSDRPTPSLPLDVAERLRDHLASVQDRGPDGEGWKSEQLRADLVVFDAWIASTRLPPASPITQPCRNCGAVSLRYAVDSDCPDVVLVCDCCGRVRTKLQRQPSPRDPGTPPDLA